ncbi:MAG TPA: PRC-barrel domain-containing protein [Ktedonobacteraceae bacterium]|jgi:sporulation protein YlmC with PRC-barrel domain|nr:PRC-barrel domain-containing protein [Ktedonobacteraceae bacterium]
MQHASSTFFIGDLLGSRIITAEGKVLGRVADIQLTSGPDYKIIALMYGQEGRFHRLHILTSFHVSGHQQLRSNTVPWAAVESFTHSIVKLKAGYEAKSGHTQP